MKIVFAPDSFKNTLSAAEVAEILKKKAAEIFPGCEMQAIPLADGDKGTIDTLTSLLGGSRHLTRARDYLGREIPVSYGVIYGNAMVIEATELLWARESMESSIQQKILFSSSRGVGELMLQGLDMGFRRFFIGAGASVVNDGGMGCAQALGVRFYNERGQLLEASGINLQEVVSIDDSGLDERLLESEVIVMCSVNNALTGYKGTTYVYSAQNGAGPDELLCLERGMRNYAGLLEKKKKISICHEAGTGACGGLPASLRAFCQARLTSGISTVLDLIRFEELVGDASLVVVGEGIMDQTTIYGKAITGIGMLCKAKGIPVVALAGGIGRGADQIYHYGVNSMMSMVDMVMEEEYAVENAEELLGQAAERMFRFLVSGMQMQVKENCLSRSRTHLYSGEEREHRLHWAVDPDLEG